MDEYSEIKKILRKICGTDTAEKFPAIFVATVISANIDARTCTVEADGMTSEDVRLQAAASDGEAQFLTVPKTGSDVLVADLTGDRSCLSVVAFTEIEAVKIQAAGENLAKILSDFIDEVAKIIVVQGTSPNVPALQQIKQRLNKIIV
ncbi:MAG: hypothetical protein LBG92_03100 [Prevotellaceae bacterium]|jgi:hypothetical protein|nr:hypothetical protein [Prevotellaceae bacterium]